MLLLVTIAAAADVWVGGGALTGVTVTEGGVDLPLSQAELDFRLANDILFVRIDADVHLDLSQDPAIPVQPLPPEYAMVEFGRERYRLQVGVLNPEFGLQEWDEWDNYLPSYSYGWSWQPSQVVGAEPGVVFDDGTKVFVYGGLDLGWSGGWATLPDAPVVGAGIASEQDAIGTWSGVFAYPTLDYYGAIAAVEVYPADPLWLTLDAIGGVAEGEPFVGGQLVANLFPEAVVNPVARVETMYDPSLWYTGSMVGGSVGVNVRPHEWVYVGVEGQFRVVEGVQAPAAVALVGVRRPEPDDDQAAYGDE